MKIEKMTLGQMKDFHEEIITKLDKFVKKENDVGVIFTWLQTLTDTLDDLSADDFFGTKGWKEFFDIDT